jgi:hypothetical protein
MAFVSSIAVLAQGVSYAQESLLGTYTGSDVFPSARGDTSIGVKLVITSVAASAVSGQVELGGRACGGDYPVQGKYEDNRLVMTAIAKGGSASDCSFSFDVAVNGNKLVGTTGNGKALRLSK